MIFDPTYRLSVIPNVGRRGHMSVSLLTIRLDAFLGSAKHGIRHGGCPRGCTRRTQCWAWLLRVDEGQHGPWRAVNPMN